MTITKGQTVYSGGKQGRVVRKIGPHAIKVVTAFERPEQDFATCKVAIVRGYREETWPIKCVTLESKVTQDKCEDAPACGCCL